MPFVLCCNDGCPALTSASQATNEKIALSIKCMHPGDHGAKPGSKKLPLHTQTFIESTNIYYLMTETGQHPQEDDISYRSPYKGAPSWAPMNITDPFRTKLDKMLQLSIPPFDYKPCNFPGSGKGPFFMASLLDNGGDRLPSYFESLAIEALGGKRTFFSDTFADHLCDYMTYCLSQIKALRKDRRWRTPSWKRPSREPRFLSRSLSRSTSNEPCKFLLAFGVKQVRHITKDDRVDD